MSMRISPAFSAYSAPKAAPPPRFGMAFDANTTFFNTFIQIEGLIKDIHKAVSIQHKESWQTYTSHRLDVDAFTTATNLILSTPKEYHEDLLKKVFTSLRPPHPDSRTAFNAPSLKGDTPAIKKFINTITPFLTDPKLQALLNHPDLLAFISQLIPDHKEALHQGLEKLEQNVPPAWGVLTNLNTPKTVRDEIINKIRESSGDTQPTQPVYYPLLLIEGSQKSLPDGTKQLAK